MEVGRVKRADHKGQLQQALVELKVGALNILVYQVG